MIYTLSYYKQIPKYSIKYKNRFHKLFHIKPILHCEKVWTRVAIQTELPPEDWNRILPELIKIEATNKPHSFQLEEGEYPTSYISTNGSAVTRVPGVKTENDDELIVEPQRTNYIINYKEK